MEGFLLWLLALTSGCGEEGRTGMWVRVTSPEISIDKIVVDVFDADSAQAEPVVEHELYLPTPENPDLWILLFAGAEYEARAIRLEGKGFRGEREVAHGSLGRLEFRRGAIVEAQEVLVLTHDGTDADRDGFYVPDDCDDQDPSINPEAQEFCDDMDNDCDGAIDEACPCSPGLERECWPQWAPEPAPGSPCAKGTQVCEGQGWGECAGLILPVAEQCPGSTLDCFLCLDTVDNDCDGLADATDTGCGGCESGTWQQCYNGPAGTENVGPCHGGLRRCEAGVYGPCEDEVVPVDEVCDGVDNDCDAEPDDPPVITGSCELYRGVCAGSMQRCVAGAPVPCTAEDYEQHARARLCPGQASDPACCTSAGLTCYALEETGALCDDQDNDCNGLPDDAVDGQCLCNVGSTQPCPDTPTGDPDQGECRAGLWVCVEGQYQMDADCIGPSLEACDNLDNDCDGTTDMSLQADDDCLTALEAAGKLETYHATMTGCSLGVCHFNCLPGYWDLEQDRNQAPAGLAAATGCEYACQLSSPVVERCDTQDNDCDGLLDGDDTEELLETLCPTRTHATVSACAASACDYACSLPYDDCNGDLHDPVPLELVNETSDGCEINLSTGDVLNCGACGNICATDHATVACEGFNCVVQGCDTGWGDCNDDPDDACERPLNTLTDCGQCDQVCALAHASESCATLSCRIDQCETGWGNCNPDETDGCETDLTSTLAHCGWCDHLCVNDHGGTSCVGSSCAPTCDIDYGDCNGQTDDGCETDLWLTTSCGATCGSRVNCSIQVQNASGTVCASGICDYGSCNSGFGNCDTNRTNGCETNLWQTGACGTTCGNQLNCNTRVVNASGIYCASGACDYNTCNQGWESCDNDRTDGCEEDLWQTTACGSTCTGRPNCNTQVVNANGISCNSGLCDFSSCISGFGSCDGDDSDGCEVNIWQLTSCGTSCTNRVNCSNQILNANGAMCSSGLCDYTTCSSSQYGDCNGTRTDGCELDKWLVTSCGTGCTGRVNCTTQVLNATGRYCNAGACDYSSCSSSQYANCDGDRTDGCEENLWQTALCGTACAGRVDCSTQVLNATGKTCNSGACDYTACSSSQYGDCDSDRTNGCELNKWQLTSCGTACTGRVNCSTQVLNATGVLCNAGACDYTACSSSQYASCDADRTNGCEANLWQLTSCGTTCSGRVDCSTQVQNATGATCASGTCDYGACASARYGDCDSNRANGCEVDLYDTANCGLSCATVDCNETVAHATGITCSSGTCDYSSCISGYADCDGNRANGCEVDLGSTTSCGTSCGDLQNCGSVIQNATGLTCVAGTCGYTSCVAGFGDCDADEGNGCEEDLWQTTACGSACAGRVDCTTQVLNATGTYCNAGTCDYASCSATRYLNCNGVDSDGCEVDLESVLNCGTSCLDRKNCMVEVLHASGEHCNTGTDACDYLSCDANWGNCDSDRTNGCEQSLIVPAFCGSCLTNCTVASWDKDCVLDSGAYRCGCTGDEDCLETDMAHDVCNTGQQRCQ